MANFRFINRLAGIGSGQATDGPSRLALLSAAGITFVVTVFFFSA